mgnify:CR=1 FL=1
MTVTDQGHGLNLSHTTRPSQGALPAFFLMTDEKRLPDPVAAATVLPPNCAVIFRHYGVPDREEIARRLIAVASRKNIRVLIAADARLALKVGADGLHLPESMAALGPGPWRAWRKPGWLVTAAAHSPMALFQAKAAGADAAVLLGRVEHREFLGSLIRYNVAVGGHTLTVDDSHSAGRQAFSPGDDVALVLDTRNIRILTG